MPFDKRGDDVFPLDPGEARHRIGPWLQAMPGQVEPLLVGFVEPGDGEFLDEIVEPHAVQRIEIGPGKITGAHPVHRRGVGAAPLVGELLPIDACDSLARAQRLSVGGHRRAPIDDGPEHVMHQRLYLTHLPLSDQVNPATLRALSASPKTRR